MNETHCRAAHRYLSATEHEAQVLSRHPGRGVWTSSFAKREGGGALAGAGAVGCNVSSGGGLEGLAPPHLTAQVRPLGAGGGGLVLELLRLASSRGWMFDDARFHLSR